MVLKPAEVAKRFTRADTANVKEIIDTLVSIGHARQTSDGKFALLERETRRCSRPVFLDRRSVWVFRLA